MTTTRLTASLLAAGALSVMALGAASTASAGPITYHAELTGAAEFPSNDSPGTGNAIVTFDDDADTLRVFVTFSGLTAPVTAAHIHCCTAFPLAGTVGVATTTPTFTDFPGGVSAGTYDHTFDLTLPASFSAAFIAANGGTVLRAPKPRSAPGSPPAGPISTFTPPPSRWRDSRLPDTRTGFTGAVWPRVRRTRRGASPPAGLAAASGPGVRPTRTPPRRWPGSDWRVAAPTLHHAADDEPRAPEVSRSARRRYRLSGRVRRTGRGCAGE